MPDGSVGSPTNGGLTAQLQRERLNVRQENDEELRVVQKKPSTGARKTTAKKNMNTLSAASKKAK